MDASALKAMGLINASLLVGTNVDALFASILVYQFVVWRSSFRYQRASDSIRAIVDGVTILQLVKLVCAFSASWTRIVQDGNSPHIGSALPWTLIALPLLDGITSIIAQLFFIRIIVVEKTNDWTGLSSGVGIIASIVQTSASFALFLVHLTLSSDAARQLHAIIIFSAFVCNGVIASNMRTTTNTHLSANVLTRALTCGTIAAMMSIIAISLFIQFPDSGFFLIPHLPMGKLYVIALLAFLLSAEYKRAVIDSSHIAIDKDLARGFRTAASIRKDLRDAGIDLDGES